MSIQDKIREDAGKIFGEIVALRREIHSKPELAFEEFQSSALVKKCLSSWGIEFTEMAKTGVVAMIQGGKPGKTIALRGDMDALPILEENDVPYVSKNAGKMHACGHDVHTSSLLGTAKILNSHRQELPGAIKLIFQPSEERTPGGASVMIREGVLANPDVKNIIGQHVMPLLDTGKIGIRPGMYMASADEIYLTIHGKGGHGAHPHMTIDPVAIAAQVIVAAQTIISRRLDPRIPAVLTFGKVIANGATNVIPDKVLIEGTFRTMDEPNRELAHRLIEETIQGISKSMGGKADLSIEKGYPVLFNDEMLTARTRASIEEFMGKENVVDLDLWMAAEDFAWYTHQVPGCFYRLGTRNESKGIVHGLHTSRFNVDEDALKISTGLMAWIAVRELERDSMG